MGFHEEWRRKYRIPLETPRLVLRPLILEDVEWLTALFLDAEVNRFLWEPEADLRQARRVAEAVVSLDLMRGRRGHWAIEDRAGGTVHGWVELSKLRPWAGPSDEIALSYVLARESWGRGIATEAAGRLLRHAFETEELDKVMAVIREGNTASRRVLEKLGMRPVDAPEYLGKDLRYFEIDRL